jgi:hypothetical protein
MDRLVGMVWRGRDPLFRRFGAQAKARTDEHADGDRNCQPCCSNPGALLSSKMR